MIRKRIKDFFVINPSYIYSDEKEYSFVPMESIREFGGLKLEHCKLGVESKKYSHIKNNNLIMAKVTPCFENNKISIVNIPSIIGLGTTEITTFKSKKNGNINFLFYYLSSPIFKSWGVNNMVGAGGLKRVPESKVKCLEFVSYKYYDQQAIANYLDHHTAKIDKQISLLEQQSKLLDEYKQALIYETVTKGLDKNVPMKDSGIEWIGEIPVHWEVKRVKDLFFLKKGKNAGVYAKEYILDEKNKGEYPVYSGQTENNGVMGVIDTFEYNFPKGALFTTTVGAKAMTVTKLFNKFSLSQNCGLLINKKKSNIGWNYYMVLNCFEFTKQNIPSYMQPSLRKEDLSNIYCFDVSYHEQQRIAECLDEKCLAIDKKKELINKKVELLKEYKKSLIYEAVTGKIVIGENKNGI